MKPAPMPAEEQQLDHYVYMLRCANGSLYTGYTRNLKARVATHNAGKGSRYTRVHRPVELVACWSLTTKREALQVEYRLKQLPRIKKLEIIEEIICPEWLSHVVRIHL
jgi:putative endonuclease